MGHMICLVAGVEVHWRKIKVFAPDRFPHVVTKMAAIRQHVGMARFLLSQMKDCLALTRTLVRQLNLHVEELRMGLYANLPLHAHAHADIGRVAPQGTMIDAVPPMVLTNMAAHLVGVVSKGVRNVIDPPPQAMSMRKVLMIIMARTMKII